MLVHTEVVEEKNPFLWVKVFQVDICTVINVYRMLKHGKRINQ